MQTLAKNLEFPDTFLEVREEDESFIFDDEEPKKQDAKGNRNVD